MKLSDHIITCSISLSTGPGRPRSDDVSDIPCPVGASATLHFPSPSFNLSPPIDILPENLTELFFSHLIRARIQTEEFRPQPLQIAGERRLERRR